MSGEQIGKLVYLEGIDGAGKTLVANALAERLRLAGTDAVFIPRTAAAENWAATNRLHKISELLWNYKPEDETQILGDRHLILLMASWFTLFHHWVLNPALGKQQIVITDQGVHKYIARFHVKGIHNITPLFKSLRKPDCVLFLKVDPVIAMRRKGTFRPTECNSQHAASDTSFVTFQGSVAKALTELLDDTWMVIDATRKPESVISAAYDAIQKHIGGLQCD